MRILLGLLLICVTAAPAWADAPIRARGLGRVNPKHSGAQARLMAERAAQIDAARHLLAKSDPRSISSVPGSNRTVIQGTLRGHRYHPTRFARDGSARVVAEIPA